MPDVRLYHEDATLRQVETEVVEAGEADGRPWVRLQRTVFHPEAGGQPADRGTIGGVEVLDVRERGDEVLHLVERPVPEGPVTAAIDWPRRFDLMQQHTAQHLVTAVLLTRHSMPTTTFHLGESYAAIEVDGPLPSPARLAELEDEVNVLVREDRPVRVRWADRDEMEALGVRSRMLPEGHTGRLRLIEIEGLDLNTCGGTHVARLGELQMIRLFHAEPARGVVRIHYLAGGRVMQRLRQADDLEAALKHRLGTSAMDFARVIDGWLAEKRAQKRRVKALEADVAGYMARELASAGEAVIERTIPGAGPDMLRAVAGAVLELRPDAVVSLVGEADTTCFLVQAGPEGPEDVTAIGEALRERLGAKGGGKGRTFQGRR